MAKKKVTKRKKARVERPGSEAEIKQFIADLTIMHVRAGQLGMHITGHALHKAVQKVGWELAMQTAKDEVGKDLALTKLVAIDAAQN